MPTSARMERVSMATAGVGIGPSSSTSMPHGGEPRHHRIFDHVAREPGVLADHRPMAVIAALEHRMPVACATFIARSGVTGAVGLPADAVRAEVLA